VRGAKYPPIKLLIAVNHEVGTFNLYLLEEKIQRSLSPTRYKVTQVKVKKRGIQSLEVIDFHKKKKVICFIRDCCSPLRVRGK